MERDLLDASFKNWRGKEACEIMEIRDMRERSLLRTRYDSREGHYDWQLMMQLHQKQATMIQKPEYLRFRFDGVAFQCRQGFYPHKNRSLESSATLNQGRQTPKKVKGYWGDMTTGPFITFGTETDNKDLLKTNNGVVAKSATEITQYNLNEIFYEILHQCPYNPEESTMEVDDEDDLDESGDTGTTEDSDDEDYFVYPEENIRDEYEPITVDNITVHLLPAASGPKLHLKEKYQKFFHCIFMGTTLASSVYLNKVSAPGCSLTIELAKYYLDLSKERVKCFESNMNDFAKKHGFVPKNPNVVFPQEGYENVFSKFVFKPQNDSEK